MRIVGLTGGIACGKSTVTEMLRDEHILVIDCDLIAARVTRKGHWGFRRVVKSFGTSILTPGGEIDREALGRIVFVDPHARRRLNSATHLPITLSLAGHILWAWLSCCTLLVVDMPLLFETGAYKLTSPRVLIACDTQTQLLRLKARDASTESAARSRMNSQMPLESKRKLADVVIDNSSTLEITRAQVAQLAERLKSGVRWQIMIGPVSLAAVLTLIYAVLHAHISSSSM